jgi:hypothetical protein
VAFFTMSLLPDLFDLPNIHSPAGLPNENDGAAVVVPPVDEPEVPPTDAAPKSEGFAAPPLSPPVFPNENAPEAGCDAPDVVCALPKSGGLLAAGVVDAAPNSEAPELAAPLPKRGGAAPGVLEPEFALFALFVLPNKFEVPGVAAPPNRGLFGVLLLLVPKLNAMVREPAASPSVWYVVCRG